MNALNIILQKRDGNSLGPEQIDYMVKGYTYGEISDYQMSAFLMSVFFRGMNDGELVAYTNSLIKSGKSLSWDDLSGTLVDKHSSGGVGDKTTLVVAPLVAAAGLFMPKMSGRGLGFTGGTIDKLESIPGFRADISIQDLKKQVARIGLAVISQTEELTPADGKIYALRDITATVESIPLIAASIMSKKIAGGAECIILDVKTGSGAFMKKEDEAEILAKNMVKLGVAMGRKVRAIVSSMEQPLGSSVGNALEITEVVSVLKGEGPEDLKELSLMLASYLLLDSGKAVDINEAFNAMEVILSSGKAYEKFEEMVKAQGGELTVLKKGFPAAINKEVLKAEINGYIKFMDALSIGKAAAFLGAGRLDKKDIIDHSAGVFIHAKKGEWVEKGTPVLTLYTNNRNKFADALEEAKKAFSITDNKFKPSKLIKKVL